MTLEPDTCAFCRVVLGAEDARIVWRSPDAIAFLPVNPATRGHTLVIPTNHVTTIFDMDEATVHTLAAATMRVAVAVRAAFRPEGLNVIQSNGEAATQTVPHVHVHVVPRWAGDQVRNPWPDDVDWSAAQLDEIARDIRTALERTT